jgi:lipopolysaccharide transport system permease protein
MNRDPALADASAIPLVSPGPAAQPALAGRGAPPPGGCARAQNHRRAGPAKDARRTVIVDAGRRRRGIDAAELWAYRGLFFFLVWRDIKVRYAQTVLGAGWAVLQPLFSMVVFTIVFGKFARIPSDGVPYPVFSFAALVPWAYFSAAFTGASNSLLGSVSVFTKVYFPRLIIPCVPALASMVDFSIAFTILLVMAAVYGIFPSAVAIVVIPLAVLVMMATAIGVGCFLAATNIQYRDLRVMTAFLLQAWMFLTPIVYPLSIVPEAYRTVYLLNPMVGAVEGFRSVLLGTIPVPWSALGIALAVASLLLVSGVLYFRRTEPVFADVA